MPLANKLLAKSTIVMLLIFCRIDTGLFAFSTDMVTSYRSLDVWGCTRYTSGGGVPQSVRSQMQACETAFAEYRRVIQAGRFVSALRIVGRGHRKRCGQYTGLVCDGQRVLSSLGMLLTRRMAICIHHMNMLGCGCSLISSHLRLFWRFDWDPASVWSIVLSSPCASSPNGLVVERFRDFIMRTLYLLFELFCSYRSLLI